MKVAVLGAGVIGGIRYDHPEVVAIMNDLATK